MSRFALSSIVAAATLAATAAAQAAPATYAIDPTHTFVTFEAKHYGTSTNRGRFDKKSGTITLDKAAKTGKVELTIETGSINTGTGAFDGHLKSKDFFNSEAFPTATFVSDKFIFEGDKVTAVVGNFTLLGKTQTVTLKATSYGCYENARIQREVCGGDFETTIQRSEYGMGYGLPFIPNDIKLLIQVEAVKQ
ncbi:YceI family protein [Aquabacterium sp.]|uniref:YceI family protein n=1 Tax=Aquabacterium sp. TaxID=1872578 RepID=UPI0025BC2A21|nr:YceI family protein [Aquabacterium sp.]